MQTLATALLILVSVTLSTPLQAQIKAPSDYFPKNYPPPKQPNKPAPPPANSRPAQPQPATKPAAKTTPAKPAVTKQKRFADLPVNTQFYFLSDTNRSFPWTKISATTARNSKKVTQTIASSTQVRQ